MSVVIKGKPQNGDIINVENIQSANVDVFNTLDNLIKTLDSPIAGDEKALAKLANDLATANKKLSTNYDNVLTVAASVNARMNELEALDATGSQKGLSYTKSPVRPGKPGLLLGRQPAGLPPGRAAGRVGGIHDDPGIESVQPQVMRSTRRVQVPGGPKGPRRTLPAPRRGVRVCVRREKSQFHVA